MRMWMYPEPPTPAVRAMTAAAALALAIAGCEWGDNTTPGGPDAAGDDPELPELDHEWSCNGLAGETPNPAGSYYVTTFGCWVDADGGHHDDAGDNCIPYCQGRSAEYDALCGDLSGPACERAVGWYAAGSDRFGCMTRLRVTEPVSGRAAVVVVLDRGPNCSVEDRVDHWILDLSRPAAQHLLGKNAGAADREEVWVEVVDPDTPLGPAGTVGDRCDRDAECDGGQGECSRWFDEDQSQLSGLCTRSCDQGCPGGAATRCVDTGDESGQCAASASPGNRWCELVSNSVAQPLRDPGAPGDIHTVCVSPTVPAIACVASGATGSCIDTRVQDCQGTLHTGACPGSSAIRCCTE